MNESLVDGERAVIAHDQSAEVAQPSDAEFDDPSALVAAPHATVLRQCPVPVGAVRRDQGDPAPSQPVAPRVAVVALVGNHSQGLLSRPPAVVPPSDSARGQRFFRQPDLGGRGKVKSDSQRNTATIHFVPLPRLVLPTPEPLFSPGQNSRPKTIRSTLTAGVRSIPPETFARCAARCPVLPSRAAAANRWPAKETPRANPAGEPRCAKSTRCLPAPCGSPPVAAPRADVCAVEAAKARFSFTARRSAIGCTAAPALPLALFPPQGKDN